MMEPIHREAVDYLRTEIGDDDELGTGTSLVDDVSTKR
jgi:hypothetical protein